MVFRNCLFFVLLFICVNAYSQQDVDFHLNAHLLPGKKILKVKRDFYDPYVWVLAQNDEVYRVNSLTLAIDDYTATFSAYHNLQFIDIAGRSLDTVFIATKSTNVIQFKKGAMRLIASADGIPYTVNSIGIEKKDGVGNDPHTLIIATDNAHCRYNINTEQAVVVADNGVSKIFEATYRREIYKDSSDATANFNSTDTIQYMPMTFKGEQAVFDTFLWEGGKSFGYNINTGYVATSSIYNYDDLVDYTSLFWGNSRGMFQVNSNYSYTSVSYHDHYLNGINVNKITSIYGLVAFGDGNWFGDPRYIKENLLVGTDNGLYFSNSIYNNYEAVNGYGDGCRNVSLVHYDAIGIVRINDVCVNPAAITIPICEDGVWLAADDGLYYIKPDYSKFTSTTQLQLINFNNQPISVSQTKICFGDSVLAIGNTQLYPGKTIQWYQNGQELPVQSGDTLSIKTAGDYYAVLYDPCEGIHMETNHLTVTVINGPVFSFNYPNLIQQCNNSPDTLKTDNNPGYRYQWYTNGVLNGDTTSSFIVTQSGKYKVEVSACTNSWVPSKEIEVDLIALPVPQITADKSVYCAADIATLSVNTPADPAYTINWYRNGNLLTKNSNLTTRQDTMAGNYTVVVNSNVSNCSQASLPVQLAFTPAPVFTFNYPAALQYCNGTPLTLAAIGSSNYQYRWYKNGTLTGDITAALAITQAAKYNVEVSACAGSWISSKTVQVDFVQLPNPIIAADKPAYCIGDIATFSIAVPPNPYYTVNWYNNNILLPANSNMSTLITNVAGNYTVSVVNNSVNSDGTTCSQTSAVQSLVFNPPPTVSIQEIIKTTICSGQTIDLLAQHTIGTVKWSTGETTDQISVTAPGNYMATVTSPAGCTTDTSIAVTFLPDPVFYVKDTSICAYKHQAITLTAPPGFSQYTWNGETNGQTYSVSYPQTVSLTITDANGCQTTQQIKVEDQCPNVIIPNTFTPNGDGINDTWNVEGLYNDQTVLVRVFNRYGTQVYQSKGYGTPWNGAYNNQKLPTGTYYYIITAKNNTQKFSGPVNIIY